MACGLLAALATLALYWPARQNEFVWDDWAVVVRLAESFDTIPWQEALLRPPADYPVLFRPLTMLTFLLQMWAGQSGPEPFHTVNLLVHAGNVLLLTLVAWHLLDGQALQPAPRLALAASCSLVYGFHPALTEPVVWISARSDPLMTSLLCLALLGDQLLPQGSWRRALALGTLFIAAMLCKETAVGFLAALPLLHLARLPASLGSSPLVEAWVSHYRVYAALLGALALYFAARFVVLGPFLGLIDMESPARHIESPGQYALVVAASLAQHIVNAIWPFQNIAPGRHLPLPISATEVLPAAALSAVLILLAFLAAWRGGAIRVPAWLFLAFVASLLPVANIVPIPAVTVPTEIAVGSRYLAFPLVFVGLAVPFLIRAADVVLVTRARYGRAFLGLILGLWLLGSTANVRVTISLWKNDAIMNTWAIQQDGPSSWRYANLGAYYVRQWALAEARNAYMRAVELRPNYHFAWYALGAIETSLGNYESAILAHQRALETNPDDYMNRIRLAALERSRNRSQTAVELLEEGLRRFREPGFDPQYEGRIRLHLGLAYRDIGRRQDAETQFSMASALVRAPEDRATLLQALQAVRAQNKE